MTARVLVPELRLTETMSGDQVSCAAVLFDLDGTLVDSRLCVERTWLAWCHAHGLDSASLFRISAGRRNRDAVREIAPHLDVEREVAWLMRAEERCRDGLTAVAGAPCLLSQLPRTRWAVVTSAWRRLTKIRLEATGLPFPDVAICADDVVHGKPHPEGYLRAAEQIGADPGDCVVVEDAAAGRRAAAAASMRTIGVTAPTEVDDAGCLWQVQNLTTLRVSTP